MTTNKPKFLPVWQADCEWSDDVLVVRLSDYEALQAECEKWKRGSEIRDEQNRDLHSFIMELKAECEKLRKDAGRYRWLRDGNNVENSEAIRIALHHYGDEWDEMIDAAMQEDNQ